MKKNNKKKIMFFLSNLSGGGAERTTINVINNLDKNKYDLLLVLTNNKQNDYEEILHNNIKLISMDAKRARKSIFKLRKIINYEKPDLLFSTMNHNNITLLLANLISFKNIPVVVREANNRTESGKVTFLNNIITRILYNYGAKSIISLSKGVKKDLVENFKINENKIKVIYNPVEIDKIAEMGHEVINDFSISEDQKIIAAVGRLVKQKNYPLLLRAFAKVRKNINCKLMILGKGNLQPKLNKLAEELGISKDIIFLGFKNNPYKYMQKADIFVLSSDWEGFGHVIVEAMSLGLPVISTDCKSGPKEIIGNEEYGLLVPTNNVDILSDKILKLLNNKKLQKQLTESGHQRANDFRANKITREYEKIFLQSIKNT